MKLVLPLGSTPYGETCAALGEDDYEARARAECTRFIKQLRRTFGREPHGAQLSIRGANHDFGVYYEVAITWDDQIPEAEAYAVQIEGNLPERWH